MQLPSGKQYAAITDTTMLSESKLGEGTYAICVCLGTTSPTAHPAGYLVANGNGGCNDANEFTRVFSPTTPGRTLKIISEPRLGRYADAGGQLTLRALTGVSYKYHIKASSTTSGKQVANNDRIYFAPKALGCGQTTQYTGADRRWRTRVNTICTVVAGANQGTNCDANFDG